MSEQGNSSASKSNQKRGDGGARNSGRGGGGRRGGHKGTRGKENKAPVQRQRLESEMSDGGDHCTVCLYNIEIYAIGECNHAVCHKCATRMRVLCLRNECAICRRDLPKIILMKENRKYEELKDAILPMDQKFKICFETEEIEDQYAKLLGHECTMCEDKPTFRNFLQMKKHMNLDHKRFYCDLCVDHLKIFSDERKHYTKEGLSEHRTKGDKEDTSFKGHPLCEYCGIRFLDRDELYKHLRKDHYFCHFCDADGNQYFFSEYKDLRQHFKKDHYLCEEPECEEEKFVVFRTELDFKAHKLERHSASKSAFRQNRKVDLEFTFNRREGREEGGGFSSRNAREERLRRYEEERQSTPETTRETVPDLVQDFPTLMGAAAEISSGPPPSARPTKASDGLAKKLALSSGQNVPGSGQSWSGRSGAGPASMEEFPSLPGASGSRQAAPAPIQPYRPAKKKGEGAKNSSGGGGSGGKGHGGGGGGKVGGAEEFPGLPAPAKSSKVKPVASVRPSAASIASRPALATSAGGPQRSSGQSSGGHKPGGKSNGSKPSKSRPFDPFDDSSEDEYPSLGGGGGLPAGLDFSSAKAFRSSGQGVDYTSKETSSNIKTVDRALLDALKGNRISEPSASVPQRKPVTLSNKEEFPGLGPSGSPDTVVTNKKNKKSKQGGGSNQKSEGKSKGKSAGQSNVPGNQASLSSIASILGYEEERRSSNCDKAGRAAGQSHNSTSSSSSASNSNNSAKPVAYAESILRPSKQKPVPSIPEKEVKPVAPTSDDFPSFDLKSKGLGLNFIAAEDKLVPAKQAQSQWNNNNNNNTSNNSKKKNNSNSAQVTESSRGVLNEMAVTSPRKQQPAGKTFAPSGHQSPDKLKNTKQYYVFLPPPDFQERNNALISSVSNVLGNKSLEFKKFKEMSVRFRSGELSSSEFLSNCSKLIERKDLVAIFSELMVLLPDINKQDELYSEYKKKFPEQINKLGQCRVCRQVMLSSEMKMHSSSHEIDQDFPVLG